MDIDLAKLSISDLNELEKKISSERSGRAVRDRIKLIDDIKSLAKQRGFELKIDVKNSRITILQHKTERNPDFKPSPKFVNPDNPNETWSGRGKRTAWLKKALASGKQLEDFLVE